MTYDPSADLESPEQKAVTATAADDIWTPEQMGDRASPYGLPGIGVSAAPQSDDRKCAAI
jgi:hypothetical protein